MGHPFIQCGTTVGTTTTRDKSVVIYRCFCKDTDESPKAGVVSSATYLNLGLVHILGLYRQLAMFDHLYMSVDAYHIANNNLTLTRARGGTSWNGLAGALC
jgi:hypothetical protein